jgi:hypothetical protein
MRFVEGRFEFDFVDKQDDGHHVLQGLGLNVMLWR